MSLKRAVSDYNERFFGEMMLEEFQAELGKYGLTTASTILELETSFGSLLKLRGTYEQTCKLAQNELTCLLATIEDIQAEYMVELTEQFFDELQNKQITIPMRFYNGWSFDYLAFQCMQEGYNATIFELRRCFLTSEDLERGTWDEDILKEKLESLSLGVAQSLLLKELEERRNELMPPSKKIVKHQKLGSNNLNTEKGKLDLAGMNNAPTYFELKANYYSLKKFKHELEHHRYIINDLPMDNFRRIFLCQDDPQFDKIKSAPIIPIDWAVAKSHLGFLIKLLSKQKIIIGKEYYKIAENCFRFKGEPIANSVFHDMQLPAENAKRILQRIADTLK